MPALLLFERKTVFAGDDLQFGAFVTAVLRGLQLTLLLGPVLAHVAHECRQNGGFWNFLLYDPSVDADCHNSHLFGLLLVLYAAASCLYGLASLMLEWRIAHWSGVGTPTETHERSPKVSYLLEVKLAPFSFLLFIVWLTGMSSLCFAPNYYNCREMEDRQNWVQGQEEEGDADNLLYNSSIFSRIRLWGVAIFFLLLSQASELLVAFLFVLHLCSKPKDHRLFFPQPASHLLDSPSHNHELVEQMWADRCAAACQCLGVASCFAFGGREMLGQAEFGDVARLLADYLETRGVLDVVPSDIVMGLLLLQRIQLERSLHARSQILEDVETAASSHRIRRDYNDDILVPKGSTSEDLLISLGQPQADAMSPTLRNSENIESVLLSSSTEDMMALGEGARYSDYALAIYTWFLYLYVHPITGIPRLISSGGLSCCASVCQCFFSRESNLVHENGNIDGDNICQTHKTALLLTAGLKRADLMYAQLRSSFAENPYCILLDHDWKSVVVSIRGTFSLEDCVTDVLIEPEPLDQLGQEFGFNGAGQFCHGGVLLCARNIYQDLQRHRLLDDLLLGDHARYPGYTLKFVGHSLGASICTVLSYMMRPKFPGLKCINYSPPGWSLTWEAAKGCEDWCTTYVLDSDIVPRLSQKSMEVLRDEILELIGRVKVPKIEVVNRLVRGIGTGSGSYVCIDPPVDDTLNMHSIEEILYAPDEVPDSEYRRQLTTFKRIQEERRLSRGPARSMKLYPPGKVIHLVKINENATCCHRVNNCLTCFTTNAGFVYTPMRINNDALDEIVVNPHMGTDHFPHRMSSVIRSVAESYGIPW